MNLDTQNIMQHYAKSASSQALKRPSFRTNLPRLQARRLRVQASSRRPQAPVSLIQGTSAQAPGSGNRQRGQMNFLDDVQKSLFGGVIDVLY